MYSTLPVLDSLSSFVTDGLVAQSCGAAAVYLGSAKIEINKTTGKMSKFEFPHAGRGHILALLGVFFLLIAGKSFFC
ncbi:MAG: hypothetical protein IPK98_18440 [Chloracidobacterium sp.]|nr:hypothetical protein [Chloracidobacterium sp.]